MVRGFAIDYFLLSVLLIFVKQMELINSQKTYVLPTKAPPNKFEGATPGSINNAKLNKWL
ncbi:hypothetical protein ES703_14384 [subsurface metagenome]